MPFEKNKKQKQFALWEPIIFHQKITIYVFAQFIQAFYLKSHFYNNTTWFHEKGKRKENSLTSWHNRLPIGRKYSTLQNFL